jgi:hypothetical protein
MRRKQSLYLSILAVLIAAAIAACAVQMGDEASQVRIDNDDIGGVVTSATGPEAGVWVIAETTELPTRFAKMVVTDDQGRYVLPDLPKASYNIWVRGYGLVDSPKIKAAPGNIVNLSAVVAPNEAAAAQYDAGEEIVFPVAHHDGNYQADEATLDRLEGEGRVAFRYLDEVNGSARRIAGILNDAGNVLGLMPHPERVIEPAHGGADGRRLFEGLLETVSA